MTNEKKPYELPIWAKVILLILYGSLVVVAIVSPIIGLHDTAHANGYRKAMLEAIDHGYAEYDSKTGQLRWKGKE